MNLNMFFFIGWGDIYLREEKPNAVVVVVVVVVFVVAGSPRLP